MAMSYARPVNYQSPLFTGPHSEYIHESVPIKAEPISYDYPSRDSACCFNDSSMEDFKHSFIKSKSVLRDTENDSPPLTSWTTKHPQHWTKKEVLDWIFFVVEQEHLDGAKLQGEAYRDFTGQDLCRMTKKDFLKADPFFGAKMYETFRNLINDVSFEEPKPESDLTCLETFNHHNNIEYNLLNNNISHAVLGTGHQHQLRHHSEGHRSDHISGSNNNNNNNNSSKHDDSLIVYKTDNEMKVNIPSWGLYPISYEIEFPTPAADNTVLPSKLTDAASFTHPSQPLSPSQFPAISPLLLSSTSFGFSSSSSSSSSMSSTKPRSSSLSSYPTPTHFTPSCVPPMTMRLGVSPSSSSSSTSSSSKSPTAAQVSLSLSISVPSSSQSSSSVSSSPPCRLDGHDPGYSSDDSLSATSFMPPYGPTLPGHMYDPCPVIDNGEMAKPLLGRAETHSEDIMADCVINDKKKNGKKQRINPTKNGNHLWEFVRSLLRDPKMNPKLVKWEDKENGVFRFVQSEKVAQLWGEKKNNPQMTYEKLSRAMRFCRTAGYFDQVPKNGKFPKKLCFMFGEKAHGWRD